ncbi:MAG: hypothetical protein H8E68_05235 [Kiritimatiellaeota bacterium]|nr:hypothetical protein [Kiritimatiellota bacterium]
MQITMPGLQLKDEMPSGKVILTANRRGILLATKNTRDHKRPRLFFMICALFLTAILSLHSSQSDGGSLSNGWFVKNSIFQFDADFVEHLAIFHVVGVGEGFDCPRDIHLQRQEPVQQHSSNDQKIALLTSE